MHETFNFFPLLLVIGLAFIIPLLLSRFKTVPVVVGEIIAGIIIGKSGLNLVHSEITLELIAEIGFAFLMFLSGLEIDFSLLFPRSPAADRKKNPIRIALLNFAITLTCALIIGLLLVQAGFVSDPWIMALILSTTSLGIVVPVLKERELATSKFGQVLLLSALFADFITMLLITIYATAYSSGLTIEILLIGLLFLVGLLIYRLGAIHIKRPTVRKVIEQLEGATSQFKVRGALALMMGFVVLAETVEVELILGAFLAGAIIALLKTREDEVLVEKLDALGYGLFIPVFFIMIGVEFDLRALLGNSTALLLAPLLLLIAFGLKFIASLTFRTGFSWRETFAGGALLSARLSLIIAASAIGLRMGVISSATNSAIILVAALTSTLAPLTFNWILPPKTKKTERSFLIFGGANIGLQVGQELRKHGEKVTFLEPDARIAKFIRAEDFNVLEGEGTRKCLEYANAADVDALLALSNDDAKNFEACNTAKGIGVERIIAMVNEPTLVSKFKEIGVNALVANMFRAVLLATLARNPDIFSLLTQTTSDQDIRRFRMQNPVFEGRKISSIVLPGDSLIMTIGREGEVLIPHGTTRLQLGDRLSIIGTKDALNAIKNLMEK
jgi:Kef-type K+ transport system membrane component KefB/Trk K+ transport system NAD-binding subunit